MRSIRRPRKPEAGVWLLRHPAPHGSLLTRPCEGGQHPPSTAGDGEGQRCEKHALAGGRGKTHIPVGRTSKVSAAVS